MCIRDSGIPDYLDDDDDGDGIPDFLEEEAKTAELSGKVVLPEQPTQAAEKDSDGDGIPDYIDDDDDNDGIPDYLDDDDDGDGILDIFEEQEEEPLKESEKVIILEQPTDVTEKDSDGDGIPDSIDDDDDNDGIPDYLDDDDDGNGILDFLETESDQVTVYDQFATVVDTAVHTTEKTEDSGYSEKDSDGDGIPDYLDDDDDNDGIPDYLDDDDDGDGILDFLEESEVIPDVDVEPKIPIEQEKDTDGDGIPDSIDDDDDNDGIPDYLDDDDDGDGILDFLEADADEVAKFHQYFTPDEPSTFRHEVYDDAEKSAEDDVGVPGDEDLLKDTDGDGIPDSEDEDDDNDAIPDHLDDDRDGDGILDFYQREAVSSVQHAFESVEDMWDVEKSVQADKETEETKDTDGDGIPDYLDDDDDNDGIPDYLDDDDDGDGIPDSLEQTETDVENDMSKYFDIYTEEQQPVDESQLLSVDHVEPVDNELKPVADLNKSFAAKTEPVFLADNLIHVGIDIDMVSDADGDGIPDYRDDDDDNDCIPDHLDMDTEVQPIALRLVNGPKVKFDGEENLGVLFRRLQGQEPEPDQEQQKTAYSGIFSKVMKTISGTGERNDDTASLEAGVSMFTSVFESFKKSILEEDEDDGGKHESEDTENDIDLWNVLSSRIFSGDDGAASESEGEPVVNPKPTVTEMISSFLTNIVKSTSDSSRQKGR